MGDGSRSSTEGGELEESANPTQILAYHRCTAVVRPAVLLCCRCGLPGSRYVLFVAR